MMFLTFATKGNSDMRDYGGGKTVKDLGTVGVGFS